MLINAEQPQERSPFISLILLPAALCALIYLGFVARPVSWVRSAVKTMAIGFLVVAAVLQGANYGLVVGLALCAAGDYLLSRSSLMTFKAGIAAFALGHLAFMAVFLTHPLANTFWLIQGPQIWIASGILAVSLIGANVLLHGAGSMRYPVLGYIPVLLGMAYSAFGLAGYQMTWVLPAVIAFVLSDLALGIEVFVLPPGHAALRFTPYLIWPLYWGAMFGLLVAFI